jgi:hypothetical protein
MHYLRITCYLVLMICSKVRQICPLGFQMLAVLSCIALTAKDSKNGLKNKKIAAAHSLLQHHHKYAGTCKCIYCCRFPLPVAASRCCCCWSPSLIVPHCCCWSPLPAPASKLLLLNRLLTSVVRMVHGQHTSHQWKKLIFCSNSVNMNETEVRPMYPLLLPPSCCCFPSNLLQNQTQPDYLMMQSMETICVLPSDNQVQNII